jgi:hypothetical protein
MNKAAAHTHYETLRVDRHASPQRVRTAYRRLAQKFHPDRYQGRGDSAGVMAQINLAYAVLSDADQRAAYDQALQAEDSRAAELTARRASAAALAIQDRFGWAGWLLLAIASITVLTLGFVAMRMLAPARPALQVPVSRVAPADAAGPSLAPTPPIQPWTEPPKASRPANEATDPVTRLVREGVVTPAPGASPR